MMKGRGLAAVAVRSLERGFQGELVAGLNTAHTLARSSASRCYAKCHTWAVERTSRRLPHVRIGRWFRLGRRGRRVLVTSFSRAEAVHAHQIQDDRVVYDAIDGCRRRYRIFKNAVPLGENQVCRNRHAESFVPLGQKCK